MSWIQRLCDVYDMVSRADIPEDSNHAQLIPIGFTEKNIKYVVTIKADGAFSSVNVLEKAEGKCIVPSTNEAEGRTGSKGDPYPLADSIKYFIEEEGTHNELLDRYLNNLKDWCDQPEAPDCLRTLYTYLSKRTLLCDMQCNLPKKLNLHKQEDKRNFDGKDADEVICFSVEDYASIEMRLWKRSDVQDSWAAYFVRRHSDKTALCYVTGEELPLLDNHPKVQGNAKLISAKDTEYPFQYKGRFIYDNSAATVSASASNRAHHALQYLMSNQGLSFRKFGLNIVAWEVQTGQIQVPLNEYDADSDDYEDEDNINLPDTFERYSQTLCDAARGAGRTASIFDDCIANLVNGEERASSVVIMSMESVTKGRMSINYYQELPDDLYVDRLTDWYRSCCWTYWSKDSKKYVVRTPMPLTIANAVMGTSAVSRAGKEGDNSDAKRLHALYKRLLSCIVDGVALPRDFIESAVHRAETPLTFRDKKGNWQRHEWENCMRTTCAMIRRSRFDALPRDARVNLDGQLPSDKLDKGNQTRDYLYGRLLALADFAEYKAKEKDRQNKLPTNAIRLAQRFAQRPKETWLHLHAKLIPYLAALGCDNDADFFMRTIADIESLFERKDRESTAALNEDFLLGYLAQRQEFYTANNASARREKVESVYSFGTSRSELFGMLAAVADDVERYATRENRGERIVSTHEGNTAALRMMVRLTQQPAAAWAEIHAKLLPYLEKLGIRQSKHFIKLLRDIESSFDCAARPDNSPLDSLFINGFYRMRACLFSGGNISLEAPCVQNTPLTRDGAYATLLAIENNVERQVLDMEKCDDDNRTSNAIRFMNKFAASPASTWRYLEERMQPYLRKLRSKRTGWARNIEERIGTIRDAIRENGWDGDEPLTYGWIHDYYTAQVANKK